MTAYLDEQLQKHLRRRCALDAQQINPPPQLRIEAIAQKYGLTAEEIKQRLMALNPERRDA